MGKICPRAGRCSFSCRCLLARGISLDNVSEALRDRTNPEDSSDRTFRRCRRRPSRVHVCDYVYAAEAEVRVGPYSPRPMTRFCILLMVAQGTYLSVADMIS